MIYNEFVIDFRIKAKQHPTWTKGSAQLLALFCWFVRIAFRRPPFLIEGLVRWWLKVYLALHYPDAALGRGVVVATSRDPDLMRQFKATVLEEATDRYHTAEDQVVMMMDRMELERLERLLTLLVPASDEEGDSAAQ